MIIALYMTIRFYTMVLTTACCDATQEAAVPTVSAGPCTLPLYQKPLDPTGRRTKALGGEVRLTVAIAPP